MKKVEVVIDNTHLRLVLEILESSGVSGYTIIRDVIGKGDRGTVLADEPSESFKNSYIFTICDEERAKSITSRIAPVIRRFGGACFLSDVEWLMH